MAERAAYSIELVDRYPSLATRYLRQHGAIPAGGLEDVCLAFRIPDRFSKCMLKARSPTRRVRRVHQCSPVVIRPGVLVPAGAFIVSHAVAA